jgi:hypothetical protein
VTRPIPDTLDADARALFRAVNFASMLGVLFALIGGILLVPASFSRMNLVIAGSSLLATTGALLIVTAIFLGRQQRWALHLAAVLTTILIVAFFVGTGLVVWAASEGSRFALLFLVLLIPLIVVMFTLLLSLHKCRRLRWFTQLDVKGFDVVVPTASSNDSLPSRRPTGQSALDAPLDGPSTSPPEHSRFTPPPIESNESDSSSPRE